MQKRGERPASVVADAAKRALRLIERVGLEEERVAARELIAVIDEWLKRREGPDGFAMAGEEAGE